MLCSKWWMLIKIIMNWISTSFCFWCHSLCRTQPKSPEGKQSTKWLMSSTLHATTQPQAGNLHKKAVTKDHGSAVLVELFVVQQINLSYVHFSAWGSPRAMRIVALDWHARLIRGRQSGQLKLESENQKWRKTSLCHERPRSWIFAKYINTNHLWTSNFVNLRHPYVTAGVIVKVHLLRHPVKI